MSTSRATEPRLMAAAFTDGGSLHKGFGPAPLARGLETAASLWRARGGVAAKTSPTSGSVLRRG